MNGLRTHLWKEWRDRRPILIGIAIALPIIDTIAVALFGKRFAAVFGDPQAGTAYTFEGVVAVPAALAIFLFTVAADLFGTERRQGTLTLLQRVPGGARRAFLAKTVFLGGGLIAVIAWQLVSMMIAWLVLGQPARAGAVAVTASRHLTDLDTLAWFVAATVAVTSWVALVSTWIPRSGAAAVAGLLLLAALLSPLWWVHETYPGFWPVDRGWRVATGPWPMSLEHALWIPVGITVITILLSAVSFLRWSRFDRSGLSVAWRGLTVVLVLAGVGYSYGSKALHDYLRIDPFDPSFRIQSAVIGSSQRFALIEPEKDLPSSGSVRWQVPRPPWLIDLETGRWSPVGESAGHLFGEPFVFHPKPAEPWLIYEASSGEEMIIQWWDLETGEPSRPTTADSEVSIAYWRSVARESTWQRDSKGRRVWVCQGTIEREEPDGTVTREASFPNSRFTALPDGWLVWRPSVADTVRVDLETGESLGSLPDPWNESPPNRIIPLSIRFAWARTRHPINPRDTPPELLVDLDTGEQRPVNSPGKILFAADEEHLVVVREGKDIAYWNPFSDEVKPVDWAGDGEGIGNATTWTQPSFIRAPQRTPDGDTIFLQVNRTTEGRSKWALATFDLEHGQGRVVTPWSKYMSYLHMPVCVTRDGALWCIEERRRLVRFQDGEREVFFPRENR